MVSKTVYYIVERQPDSDSPLLDTVVAEFGTCYQADIALQILENFYGGARKFYKVASRTTPIRSEYQEFVEKIKELHRNDEFRQFGKRFGEFVNAYAKFDKAFGKFVEEFGKFAKNYPRFQRAYNKFLETHSEFESLIRELESEVRDETRDSGFWNWLRGNLLKSS